MARNMKVRHRCRPVTPAPTDDDPVPVSTESPSPESDASYDVGYGKPPRDSRFKPGQSGNPKGRPAGTKNFKTDLVEELQEHITVKEGGSRHRISKQRAILKSITLRAMKGDPRAASLIVNMVARFLDQADSELESTPIDADDLAILANFKARVRKSNT